MKTELIFDMTMIEIARYLRRIKATLLRAVPRKGQGPRGEVEGWLIMYIGG